MSVCLFASAIKLYSSGFLFNLGEINYFNHLKKTNCYFRFGSLIPALERAKEIAGVARLISREGLLSSMTEQQGAPGTLHLVYLLNELNVNKPTMEYLHNTRRGFSPVWIHCLCCKCM